MKLEHVHLTTDHVVLSMLDSDSRKLPDIDIEPPYASEGMAIVCSPFGDIKRWVPLYRVGREIYSPKESIVKAYAPQNTDPCKVKQKESIQKPPKLPECIEQYKDDFVMDIVYQHYLTGKDVYDDRDDVCIDCFEFERPIKNVKELTSITLHLGSLAEVSWDGCTISKNTWPPIKTAQLRFNEYDGMMYISLPFDKNTRGAPATNELLIEPCINHTVNDIHNNVHQATVRSVYFFLKERYQKKEKTK